MKRFAVTALLLEKERKKERERKIERNRERLDVLDKRLCQIDGSVNAASDCLAEDRLAFDNCHALQSG